MSPASVTSVMSATWRPWEPRARYGAVIGQSCRGADWAPGQRRDYWAGQGSRRVRLWSSPQRLSREGSQGTSWVQAGLCAAPTWPGQAAAASRPCGLLPGRPFTCRPPSPTFNSHMWPRGSRCSSVDSFPPRWTTGTWNSPFLPQSTFYWTGVRVTVPGPSCCLLRLRGQATSGQCEQVSCSQVPPDARRLSGQRGAQTWALLVLRPGLQCPRLCAAPSQTRGAWPAQSRALTQWLLAFGSRHSGLAGRHQVAPALAHHSALKASLLGSAGRPAGPGGAQDWARGLPLGSQIPSRCSLPTTRREGGRKADCGVREGGGPEAPAWPMP